MKQSTSNYTFIDLFAGIGGIRTAFTNSGAVCRFTSDYDKFCKVTYEENYKEHMHGDITQIDERDIPTFDILTGGFPCQPFSIAGVSKKLSLGRKHGFEDEKQGNLFFDIARILRHHQPRAFFLENVKNLRSHDKGNTFRVIESTLLELGYSVFYKVVDAKYYVPQHRERIFIVGFRKDLYPDVDFRFPEYPGKRNYELKDILEKNPDSKYTLSDHLWNYLQERKESNRAKGNGFGFGLVDPETDEYTRTLSARYHKDGSEILIKQKGKNPRRLTPRECARLMGLDDSFKIPVSDTQAYRQFGNCVVVPAIEATARELIKTMKEYDGGQKPAESIALTPDPDSLHRHREEIFAAAA